MKRTLLLLSLVVLGGCIKRNIPDESLVMEGKALHLPPNYALTTPGQTKTMVEVEDSVVDKSKKILLGNGVSVKQSEVIRGQETDKALNLWLLKNAKGQDRVANIKDVLRDDEKSN